VKNLFLAAAVIVSATSLSTAARAADITPATYDWSSLYLGLNGGVAWNNSDVRNDFEYTGGDIELEGGPPPEVLASDINAILAQFSRDLDGDQTSFTGGAMIGYNWQHESLVFGAEADINYLGFSDDSTLVVNDVDVPFISGDSSDVTSKLSLDAEWFGTLRGRLGFAADNFLIYGTGGLAYGHVQGSAVGELVNGAETIGYDASASDTNWGWTAGAGIEYGLDNLSLGIEYLYVDLGSVEWDSGLSETVVDSDISDALAQITGSGEADFQFSVVRATAKFRF
jgi:outer membrane immunogenic protein